MKNKINKIPSILFIDSGIGGLTTLAETSKILKANYIYFADNEYVPYGAKTDAFLKQRLSKIIEFMSKKHKLSLVVLACNTATTTSISFLRKEFPNLSFVGTEPACNTAIIKSFKAPSVIATPKTISNLPKEKIQGFFVIPHKTLASQIEECFVYSSPKSRFELLKSIYPLKNKLESKDCLILGCTHYIFVKSRLSKLLNTPIFDGNFGVAKQVSRLYSEKAMANSTFKLVLSRKNKTTLQKYKKILNQILANQINLC